MSKLTREQLGVALGDTIIIRGTVKFANLDKPIDGKALDKVNQVRLKRGMKETKPFRRITLKNPSIMQGQGTPLAKFYEQSIYRNKIVLDSRSLFPPAYKQIQNGKTVKIDDPQKNPAIGQEIMIQISAFQSKGFSNLGSGLDVIIFPEGPIKFYEASRAEENLPGFGKSIALPVDAPAVNTRGFAAAPIIDPGKIGIDISNSPFSGVINISINGKIVSRQTADMTQTNANDVLTSMKSPEESLKILDEKEAKPETNTINIDSPFGPSRNSEFTVKTEISSTITLSRFT